MLSWYPNFESTAQRGSGHSGGPTRDENTLSIVGINSRSIQDGHSTSALLSKVLDEKISVDRWHIQPSDRSKVQF